MKFYQRVWIDERNIPPELYRSIVQLKPECQHNDHFVLECQPGDVASAALAERIVTFCKEHRLHRGTGEVGTYMYEVVRHYEPDDLKVAQFLILQSQKRMFRDRLERDDHGRLILSAKHATPSIQIASSMLEALYVASGAARKILEAGQLTGLIFRETFLKGTSAKASDEPFWEIDSNLKMPKMVNALLNPHSKTPVYAIDERPYRAGEPHYWQQAIQALGNFDIARTLEQLGTGYGLIISQRFYQHCLKNKIELVARPVRIDQD